LSPYFGNAFKRRGTPMIDNAQNFAYTPNCETKESPFFQGFADNIMTGEEFKAYLVQAKELANEGEPEGHLERLIKAKSRTVQIDYYLSTKLCTLFVLTAHIVRAGEPRTKEKKALQEYLGEIKRWEANYENDK
jgi:hypothetical protein